MQIGDLKFGQLKGVDSFGNKYYEDLDQPYGQHRWVEYSDIHNPDPTMIQPELVVTVGLFSCSFTCFTDIFLVISTQVAWLDAPCL
jgi:hypothetical protein